MTDDSGVDAGMDGHAVRTSTDVGLPGTGHGQRRSTPAQRCVVRHTQAEPEQTDDGAEQPLGLSVGEADTARKVSAVRIANAEYTG